MRVFAFVSVLIGHRFLIELTAAANNQSFHITIRYFFEALIPLCTGAAGVVVFFITSGYIISHVLQKETTTAFIIKRIFRIYPLYIFAVLCETFIDWYFNGTSVPPISIMAPKLLLIGDFFDIPSALNGVDWTLRIEILFYVLMATFKSAGLFASQKLLPLVYLVVSIALYVAPAFPGAGHWNAAYVNAYSLFLFIGALIYLSQQALASRAVCILVGSMLLLMFLIKISEFQPNWKESNYAIFSLALFLGALHYAPRLKDGFVIRILSDLTYSVYLFHNWIWQYIEKPVSNLGLNNIYSKLVIASILFVICYVLHNTVEKFGLAAGKIAIKKYHLKTNNASIARPAN